MHAMLETDMTWTKALYRNNFNMYKDSISNTLLAFD